jgi:hypothetical protein
MRTRITCLSLGTITLVQPINTVACDNSAPDMKRLNTLLVNNKVSGYMFGHKHSLGYIKKDGVMYILSGAGGRSEAVKR